MPGMLLPVSLVTAGGLALINLWLAVRVGQIRRAAKISVGDAGHEPLVRRMRAQANFVEYAPFALALIALIEFAQGPSLWLWLAAALFLIGRVLHALGMDGWSAGRAAGTVITMLLLAGLALYAIALPLLARAHAPAPTTTELTPTG